MQYHFTKGALIGAVLVALVSPFPTAQNSTSVALSTASFGPEFTSVAGTFTAISGAALTSTTPSSKFDIFSDSPRHLEDPEPLSNQTTHDAHNKSLPGRPLDVTDISWPEPLSDNSAHQDHKSFPNQTAVEVHRKTLQPPYLNKTTPVALLEIPGLNTTTPVSLLEIPHLNTTTSVGLPETPSSTPTESSILSTPEDRVYTRPSPINPMYFKISKSDLDHKILALNRKITYFKKQIDKAEEDITRVHKLTGTLPNDSFDDGTNLFLKVAKGHKSHAEEMLKKVEDEMKDVHEERETLLRTSKF